MTAEQRGYILGYLTANAESGLTAKQVAELIEYIRSTVPAYIPSPDIPSVPAREWPWPRRDPILEPWVTFQTENTLNG